MKLIEMQKLPEYAGEAKIEFMPDTFVPVRKNSLIKIPTHDHIDWFWLSGKQQFLTYFIQGRDEYCHFGGMDESPFLVDLDPSAYYYFLKGGEKTFYESLKPLGIRQAEKILKKPAKRQGDIFSIDVPFSLQQLQCVDKVFNASVPDEFIKGKSFHIFGTRHTIEAELLSSMNVDNRRMLAKEALLKAPDHANLELPGLHYIEQADLLKKPKQAD